MSLRSLQSEFAVNIAEHILWLNNNGYQVTLGDAHRSPEECERLGHQASCHGIRLAMDLNLFKDGVYLTKSSDHEASGLKWESRHELARNGSAWGDGNHYSFEYRGRK